MSRFRFNIESININSENVLFQNYIFDLSNVSLKFLQGENITFENCEFIGGSKPIEIQDYKTLDTYNCIYKNFNNRTFYIENIENIIVQNSIFDSCSLTKEDDDAFGGVIYAETCQKLEVQNSRFKNCKIIKNGYYGKADGCIIYCGKSKTTSLLNSSIFEKCNIIYNEISEFLIPIKKYKKTLFSENLEIMSINYEFFDCDNIQ